MATGSTQTAKGCSLCGQSFRLPGSWQVCSTCDDLLTFDELSGRTVEPSPALHDQNLCYRERCPFCFDEGAGA